MNRLAARVSKTSNESLAPGVRIFDDGEYRYTLGIRPARIATDLGDLHPWAWSPDGQHGACLTEDSEIELWSLGEKPEKLRVLAAPEGARGVLWGDGVLIAVGPKRLGFVRASDGLLLGDHALLGEAGGLRPLEDEKGDLGDMMRPEPTFALGEGAQRAWVTAFESGLVIAPESLRSGLEGALCWSLARRFAWPLRWGPFDLVVDAEAGARHPAAPDGVALKSHRAHAAVRAGWDPPEGVPLGEVFTKALRSLEGAHGNIRAYASVWVRGLVRMLAHRGETAKALAAVEQVYEYHQKIAARAEVVMILGRVGDHSAARDAAQDLDAYVKWVKIDDVTLAELAASLAGVHYALGEDDKARPWIDRAAKAMAYAEPPWPQRLAVCRVLLACGRDDDARQWWGASHWGAEAPREEPTRSFVLHLARRGQAALALEFLGLFAKAHNGLPEGLKGSLAPWLIELGLPTELDAFASALGLSLTEAQRARAAKRAAKPERPRSSARDRSALIEAHAEIMVTVHGFV